MSNKKNKTKGQPSPAAPIKVVMAKNKGKKTKATLVTSSNNYESTMHNAVSRRSKQVMEGMQMTKEISADGVGFIQHCLNPCGEHTHPNSRCTDGTLSQSAVQTLRAEDFVSTPFLTGFPATVPDTTRNWTIVDIGAPTYTGISLMIASADATQPTLAQYQQIFTQINATGVADYPAWTAIGTTPTPNFYASYWRYDSANLLYDAASGQSTSVESFRYVGDGVVVHHNCPDLWDQGGFVTGQFQCDTEYFSEPGEVGKIEIQTSGTTVTASSITLSNLSITSVTGDGNFVTAPPNLVVSTTPATAPAIFNTAAYNIRKPDGNFLVNVPANANYNWTFSSTGTGLLAISTPTTVGGPLILQLTNNVPLLNTTCYTTTQIYGAIDATSSVIIDLPSLEWSTIVQADPKRGSGLMKGHSGFYSVRRYFQPKLLMQKSNQSGNVKFSVKGMDRLAIVEAKGGILNELVDRNGAIRISVIRGISYAAQPQFKCDRFIELMPAPGSILASVTEVTPERDEDAEEIFRSLQARGAHAYVPDANFLGYLAGFLTTMIAKIPVYLRTVRSISAAVEHAAEWAEERTKFLE